MDKKLLLIEMVKKIITIFEGQNSPNKLIFTTSAGVIIGDVILDDELDDLIVSNNVSQLNILKFINSTDKFKVTSDFAIPMKNVSIINGNNTTNLGFYLLFTDSITGISIGNPN